MPVICGPTAGGKTDLAASLAHAVRERGLVPGAEIISADAFLVYRGMDIGTAKPTAEERRGVPHHLIDIRGAREPFTVEDWLTLADAKIDELRSRSVLPIVVGGTHLYIKALLDGLFKGPEPDPALRAALAAMDPAVRRAELERVDPAAAARIHPSDIRRTIRALEVFRQTGTPISQLQTQWDPSTPSQREGAGGRAPNACSGASLSRASRFQLIILDWETDALNRRINARVKQMFDRGLIDEVKTLRAGEGFGPQSGQALGYKQVLAMLDRAAGRARDPSSSELEECTERVKIETRRFAKNQRTWLRRLRTTPGAITLPMPSTPPDEAVRSILSRLAISPAPV